MTSRFRGDLTTIPPVHIAVRRSGLKTTVDWASRGADRGLLGGFRVIGDPSNSGPLPTDRYLIPGTRVDFGGGTVAAMTSDGLGQFKELLLATKQRDREIRADVKKTRLQYAVAWTTRLLAWSTLLSVFSKSVRGKAAQAVVLRKSQISTLRGNLAASRISISFDMESAAADPHRQMLSAFDNIARSKGSWALKMSQKIDRIKARSMSSTVVERRPAHLARCADPLVDTADLPMSLPVQNGHSTAYFYPGFVLVIDSSRSDFALIDLREVEVRYAPIQFTETDRVPDDARMVTKVWAKSNKNGSRDRRFKDNRELPVMLYGELGLKARGGLNESFMFSRTESCEAFERAVRDLKHVLATKQKGRIATGTKALPS